MTNILILSVGTRNKIIQYFKKELNGKGKVVATDNSKLAPALYEADKHYTVPRIDHPDYLNIILEICKDNNIKGVFSLIDPELSLLSKNKDKFLEIGVIPIISDYDVVELSFDKYRMFQFLKENNIPTVNSYIDMDVLFEDLDKGKISFPVFVKPVKGSASININKVTSKEEINLLFNQHDNLIIQEYMDGKEYGADIYIDMITGEVISIFIKEKLLMRAGETDKSVSYKNDILFKQLEIFVRKAGYRGVIDIDIFEKNGKFYISEVNPRFGGGYPHAYECGENIPRMIANNLMGIKNNKDIGTYPEEIYMMKYNEVEIVRK